MKNKCQISLRRQLVTSSAIHKKITMMVVASLQFILLLKAGNIEVTDRKYLFQSTSTSFVLVEDSELPQIINNTAQFSDKSSVGYVQLGINPDTRYCYDTNFRTIEVTFAIEYKRFNYQTNSLLTFNDTKTLIITFDPVNKVIYTEKARIVYDNFIYYIKARATGVILKNRLGSVVFSGSNYSSLPEDLYFEAGILTNRVYNFDYSNHPQNFSVIQPVGSNDINFSWTAQPGAEFYELEFLYVNNYSSLGLNNSLSANQIYTSFKNNATRVRVTGTNVTIPNVFEQGYVLGRIRSIGIGGPTLENEIPGYWSAENTYNGSILLSQFPANSYMAVSRHEGTMGDNKSWKLSATYAEEGKHKEIVEYADGSSRVRQTVTRLSSTQEAVVGETAYDYQGRPTVQILPVPVSSNEIKYYDNFNREQNTGDKLSREHFDDDAVFANGSCIPTPPQLSTLSGASYYYSPANTYQDDWQSMVPDAQMYPYTQVVYTPDNTGRIKMQSGVGDMHRLGSGHETRYFYGKPSQEELDRLFGTNVGFKSHYQKNMVIDANGQVSVSFLDMSGKTIATALAGDPPSNTEALKNSSDQNLFEADATEFTVNLLGGITPDFPNGADNQLMADGTVWSNVTPILVEKAGNYIFTYQADWLDYMEECLGEVCMDCIYDLEINILNACNEPVDGFPHIERLGGTDIDTICNTENNLTIGGESTAFEIPLEVGNYTVVKKLKLNEAAINRYTEIYLKENNCLLSRDDFFEMPDTSGCFYSCEDCMEELGTEEAFIQQYISLNVDTNDLRAIYASKKAACEKICDNTSDNLCMAGYKAMLRDMTPGGQYAKYENNNPVITSSDPLSIFNSQNFLPDFTNITGTYENEHPNEIWRYPKYYDYQNPSTYPSNLPALYLEENGVPSKVYLDYDDNNNFVPPVIANNYVQYEADGTPYVFPQYLQNVSDFISGFKDSWAKSLLIYHPEFLFMGKCFEYSNHSVTIHGDTLNNMWEYEKYIREYNYESASNQDLLDLFNNDLNSFDLAAKDPFFSTYGNTSLIQSLFTVQDFYTLKAENYAIFTTPAETLDVWEYAFLVDHCPISDLSLDISTCMPSNPGFNNTNNKLYITNNQQWERLVGSYLSLRQEVFFKKIMLDILFSNEITNRCIGAANYDLNILSYPTVFWMPCSFVSFTMYQNKQLRFGSPDMIYNDGTFDPAPPTTDQLYHYAANSIYSQTGICPLAMDIQNLIYGLHQQDSLQQTVILSQNMYLMPGFRILIESLNNGVVPDYVPTTVTSQNLTVSIGGNFIELQLPGTYTWNDVLMITNISEVIASGNNFTFNLKGKVFNSTTSEVIWITIHGMTDLPIGNCEDNLYKLCKTTPEASNLRVLLQALKSSGQIDDTNVDLTGYQHLIGPDIQFYLGEFDPLNSYTYSFNSNTNTAEFTNPATGSQLILTIQPGDETAFLNSSVSFHSITSDLTTTTSVNSSNYFILNGYTSVNQMYLGFPPDASMEGSIVYVVNNINYNFPVTDCNTPAPPDCQTPAHHNLQNLIRRIENRTWLLDTCLSLNIDKQLLETLESANYSLISIEPDMSMSTDLITSFYFTAIITIQQQGSSITDTLYGQYCLPLRDCKTCEESCDSIFYLIDLASYNPDSLVLANGLSLFLQLPSSYQNCNVSNINPTTFIPSQHLPPSSYNWTDILAAWADTLNASSGGYYQAHYLQGTSQLLLSFSQFNDAQCKCDNNYPLILKAFYQGMLNYTDTISPVCCNGGGSIVATYNPEEGEWESQLPLTLNNSCYLDLTPFPALPPPPNPCVTSLLAAANLNADNAYQNYIDSVRAAFRQQYIQQCMGVTESFTMQFTNSQYHFTLYYYDQAGNLVKTVPPEAVIPIPQDSLNLVFSARINGSVLLPLHDRAGKRSEKLSTKYAYNTLNQPRYQQTPDGGKTTFIYDALGRLAISQNAKQAQPQSGMVEYSYTTYDAMGRITEVGQMEYSTTANITQDNALQSNGTVATWIALASSTHKEITTTVYDLDLNDPSMPQHYVRNRVSYTVYRETEAGNPMSGSVYSYDVHGNVKTFWQFNGYIPDDQHQIKQLDYHYDLVSGKVNKVVFQPGKQDQWIHRYSYDADNRLTMVETSRDDVFYDRDAAYFYYAHGPLARMELGELNVQGVDYAYTIHGWLKSINATSLSEERDPGKDGAANGNNKFFGKDAVSYSLHYYTGDYANISQNADAIASVNNISYTSMYNGNIAAMQTTLRNASVYPNSPLPLFAQYSYDQLNRIRTADYNADLDVANNTWNDNFDDRHKNKFTYDANGNIITQLRNGTLSNPDMDNLTYHYNWGTNQLSYVTDAVSSTAYTDDIDNQYANNYTYDAIGNLIGDNAEQIVTINWSVYGKIKSITRFTSSNYPHMEFGYNPGGQRIYKRSYSGVTGEDKNNYYFHDASGNILAIYSYSNDSMFIDEQHMYGSSRLGTVKLHEYLQENWTAGTPAIYKQQRGQKRYELTNHLGNVLTVVSDRRRLDCAADRFYADIRHTYDYSPFGAPIKERCFDAIDYVYQNTTIQQTLFQSDFENPVITDYGPHVQQRMTYDGCFPGYDALINHETRTGSDKWFRVESRDDDFGLNRRVTLTLNTNYIFNFYLDLGNSSSVIVEIWNATSSWLPVNILTTTTYTTSGNKVLNFNSGSSNPNKIIVIRHGHNGVRRYFYVDNLWLEKTTPPTQTIFATNCNSPTVTNTQLNSIKDRYDGWYPWNYSECYIEHENNNNRLKVYTTVSNHGAHQYFDVSPNTTYHISFDLDMGNASQVSIFLWDVTPSGSVINQRQVGSPMTSSGSYDFTFSSTYHRVLIQIRRSTGSNPVYFYLDNLHIYHTYTQHQEFVVGGDGYRFGFNSKEKDNEIYGEGNSYDFGARLYDPRTGRWNACDPHAGKYASLSPYQFVANSPLIAIDPDGKDIILASRVCQNGCQYSQDGPETKWGEPLIGIQSEESILALQDFLNTTEGYQFFAQFANKGDVITIGNATYTFNEDGQFKDHNLVITDFIGYENPGANASTSYSYFFTFGENGKTANYVTGKPGSMTAERLEEGSILGLDYQPHLQVDISLYLSSFDRSRAANAITVGHEAFIHTSRKAGVALNSMLNGDYKGAASELNRDTGERGAYDHNDYLNNKGDFSEFKSYLNSLGKNLGQKAVSTAKKEHDDNLK